MNETGPEAVPPPASGSLEERIEERFEPVPEPNLKSIPSVLASPRIDSIEIKFVQDPYALVPGLLSGTIDLNLGRGISLDQAIQVRDQWPQGTMQTGLVNQIVMYPQFLNPDPVIILNTDFRRALMYGMNRQELGAFDSGPPRMPEYSSFGPSYRCA